MGALKASSGTESRGQEQRQALPRRVPYNTGNQVVSNQWPTNGFPLVKNYSAQPFTNMGSTGLKYMGTKSDNNGEFIEVEITQVGKIYNEGTKNLKQFNNAEGWSHLVLHFDPVFYENIDFDKSWIDGVDYRDFNLKDRLTGNRDIYKSDDYSVSIPLVKIFDDKNPGEKAQRATLKLYLKDNHTLISGSSYLIEHRTMGKTNDTYSQILIRDYIQGIDYKGNQFNAPEYMRYTGALNVPYDVQKANVQYSRFGQNPDRVQNVYTDVYIDWATNELHVNYIYETLDDIENWRKTQFVQLFPKEFKDVLVPDANGVYAKFNHVYKRGDLDWSNDKGITFNSLSFCAKEKDGQSGFRLRLPNNNSGYKHPWDWVTDTTQANGKDLWTNNGRFWALSATRGPISNHIVYHIDPDKFMKTFKNIDDLKFTSFFVTKTDDENIGAIIKNTESINSPAITKNMTKSPQIDDIYTDSKVITGTTGYNNANSNVFVTAKNFKNPVNEKTQLVNSDGKIEFYPDIFDGVFKDMQKDDKLSFETIYRYANYYKSRPTIEKVKARIYFDKYDGVKDKVVEVPSSDKFRGDSGYVVNGLGVDNMPEAPTKEGYIFKGWATKQTTAAEFTKAEKLTKIDQWNEGKAYIFDGTVPVNKSYRVYPVWEEENKGFTIVLHSNDGTDRTKEIKIAYDEKLPTLEKMKELALVQDQYTELANGNYSTLASLPEAYATKDASKAIFGIKEVNGEKYNFVGWSLEKDNNQKLIEDLFSNTAIIAREGQGKDAKYYLSTVRSKQQGIGQAAAAKRFEQITPDAKNEIHLYAAWKPYFTINLTKHWYDSTDPKYSGRTVKQLLQDIAHGKTNVPTEDKSLFKPIQIGLLYRTAVTEAFDPTVTDDANYYIVDGSLQDLRSVDQTLTWSYPSYDAYGKRLSYIAVEFEEGPTGKEKYDSFGQKWTNIWTSVGNNLSPGSHNWDNETIAKVQTLVVPKNNGTDEVDAFSGATVRKLYEGQTAIQEKNDNLSKVGDKPRYETKLYNIKTALANPTFKGMYDGDTFVRVIPKDDTRVRVIEFDLPEVAEKIYFQKDGDTWKRVALKGDSFIDYTESNNYTFVKDGDVLKLNLDLEGKNRYKYLKTGQEVKATYYGDKISVKSGTAIAIVKPRQTAPTLEGLQQEKLVEENGEEYVIVRAKKPTKELEQFQANAVLTLFDARAAKGKEKEKAYKGVTVTSDQKYYTFKVPKSQNPELKHNSIVSVYAEQEDYNPSRSNVPCKLDLQGPVITAPTLTVYTNEDVDVARAVTTDEDAALLKYDGLYNQLNLNKDFNTELGIEWRLIGKAKGQVATDVVALTMEDKFGNKKEQNWIINYVDRPTSANVNSAKQIPNEISSDYKEYKHKIKLEGATVGATIKVYLTAPTNSTVVAPISVICTDPNQEIEISQGIGTNINGKVWLTQTQKDKKESVALEVSMDVVAPTSPSIKSLDPGHDSLTLTGVTEDTTKIFIRVGGQTLTLTRDKDNKKLWQDSNNFKFTMTNDELTANFNRTFAPLDDVQVVVLDDILNPRSQTTAINDYPVPNEPTIVAENKGDGVTTVTGMSNDIGGTVNIYDIVKDPTTGQESISPDPIATAIVRADGTYEALLRPEKAVGTKLGATVTKHGKESPIATTTVTQNAGIIPFDPNDPNGPIPNPDDTRYVTITLDANGGQFAKGTKSSFYVLKTYVVKPADFNDARLGLEAPVNKAFDKWTEDAAGNKAFTGKTFDKDATIYASYKANDNVIPFDPDKPIPNPDGKKYVTVTLEANGGKFAQGTKSSFYVKKTYTMTTNDFAIAEKGLIPPKDKAFNAWTLDKEGHQEYPAAGKKFEQNSSVFAQYREGRDVIPGTGNDKPDGYVTVTFKADATQATLEGETTYYVNPKGKVKLGGILAPTIKPAIGYAVSYPAWTYSDNQNAASIVKADTTATASLYDKDKVIPVQDGVEVTKPAGYLDVVFKAGDNGKLEGTSKFYVRPNTESKDVPTPTPIANTGYKVKAEAWNPLIPTAYDKDFTTTAQYEALPDVSDTPQAGYVMVQFDGGEHGKVLEETDKKSIIFVNPEKEIALNDKAPTVVADINWSFDKWSIDNVAVDLSKATKYTKDTLIKATYTSDISDVSKDGFVLVQFKAGDKGVIESGNENVYVKQNKEVDLTAKAPKIKANEGYVHIGWDKPLKGTFTDTTDINAKYTDPSDISTKPVKDFSHIKFVDNGHVKIAKDAVKEYWVNPAKVVSVPAPDVVVEAGYMHIGWSTNLTQQFKQDTEITPTSMESTDVTPNQNDNYTEIRFSPASNGTIVGLNKNETYSLWINPAKVVTIQAPAIDADQGWKLTGWKNLTTNEFFKVGDAIKGQFPKNGKIPVQFQAQYDTLPDISDKPEKGYVAITFKTGVFAKFKGMDDNKREIAYYVNPGAGKTLGQLLTGNFAEPELEYYTGYKQGKTKWTPTFDAQVIVTRAWTFEANVVSEGKLPGDTTPVPKNWKTVEFRIFDYDKEAAKITGGITKYLVDPKEEVTLKAPDVKITKEGYSLDGWNHSLKAKFEQDTIIYALIGGDISTKPKDGFVKVTFAPGTNGKFEDGATTELYVRKDTEVDLGARAPKVLPNENYSHSGWTFGNKTYGTDSIKATFTSETNTITATYNEDIIEDPHTPNPPADYARVIFKPGKHGSFASGYKTNFDVRIAARLTIGDLNKPKVIADEGYFFTKWDKGNNTLITDSMDVTALYSGDIIPGTDPNTPPQEGFVRITFAPGTDGTFKAGETTFYDVRKSANKHLSDLGKPAVIPNSGYTHIGWDKADTTKLDQTMIVLALYKQSVITNPDINKPIPDGYVRVTFDPTVKGTIVSGTAVQDVLIAAKKTLGNLSKPTVQGKDGNVFSGWDTKDDTKLDENVPNRALTVTALYNDDIKVVDDPNSPIPKGYARVVFNAGDHGSFESTAVTAYDVLMKEGVKRTLGEVKKPKVNANDGYTFKAWDKADTTELVVNAKTEVTATYNQNVIISDDPGSTIPEGYVRAIFKTDGAKGAITATINGVKKTTLETVVMDVLPKTKTVGELKANITLTAKGHNVFEGWSKPDDYLVANNVTIDAQYKGGQTSTPSARARNIRSDAFTTIDGKAEPGAIVVAKADSTEIGRTTADATTGLYTIKADKKYDPNTKVEVVATKAPKTASDSQPAYVFEDKNGDGIPDGDTTPPAKPDVKQAYEGDTSVKMNIPPEPDANKIVVDVKYPNNGGDVTKVTVTKENGVWKVDGKPVPVDRDTNKMTIPLPPNTELVADQKLIVTVSDESKNTSDPSESTVAKKTDLPTPIIDQPKQGDELVKGTAKEAETIDVTIIHADGRAPEKHENRKVNTDGSYTVSTIGPLKDGDKIVVVAKADGRNPSEASKKVGLELDKIKATDKEAEDVIKDAENKNNWDPANNHFDDNLDKKKKAADDVISRAEDADDTNDPTQEKVDTAEKELRDALNKKDADTKVTKVEDAVKNGEKPSPEDIKAAQDAIDKIDGSIDPNAQDYDKDKKDLQDRLDDAKTIDELVDKIKDAPSKENDPKYDTKPDDVKKELDKAKEDAQKTVDNYKKPDNQKDPDAKTPKDAKKELDDAIDKYNQEQVTMVVRRPSIGSNQLAITTLQGDVALEIFVDNKLQKTGLSTNAIGDAVINLDLAFTSADQEIKVIGSKDGLLPVTIVVKPR